MAVSEREIIQTETKDIDAFCFCTHEIASYCTHPAVGKVEGSPSHAVPSEEEEATYDCICRYACNTDTLTLKHQKRCSGYSGYEPLAKGKNKTK